jgi:hypothetical protein
LTHCHWAKNRGQPATTLSHAWRAFLRPRSRLCLLRSHRIK